MMGRIFRPLLIVMLASVLAGCPKVYLAFEKHGGAFLAPVKGPQFAHQPDHAWDHTKNALFYLYRPLNDWSAAEIDSPTVFIDDQRYINLRGGGYTWLEVAPGTRRITLRRPLGAVLGFEGFGNFNLSKILDTELQVEPGVVYYFRYNEVDPPKVLNPSLEPDDPLAQGDMQLVSWEVAFPEIIETRLMKSTPPFAKSSAARSIVEENRIGDFNRLEAELLEARAEQVAELKAAGHWRPGNWWCLKLCGGGPTKRVKADAELRKLKKAREEYEFQIAKNENNDPTRQPAKKWWWPF